MCPLSAKLCEPVLTWGSDTAQRRGACHNGRVSVPVRTSGVYFEMLVKWVNDPERRYIGRSSSSSSDVQRATHVHRN